MTVLAYVLCVFAATAAAILLFRAYKRTKVRLLFWSGLCFAFLALNNAILVADVAVYPDTSLLLWRKLPAVIGVVFLIHGLVWDAR
jgi:hypothetical protein